MKTPGLNVELVSSGHKVIKAPVTEAIDGTLQPGKRVVTEKGRPGHRITTYRVVKQNGEIVKKELISNDYYRPEARCCFGGKTGRNMKSSEIMPQSVDN